MIEKANKWRRLMFLAFAIDQYQCMQFADNIDYSLKRRGELIKMRFAIHSKMLKRYNFALKRYNNITNGLTTEDWVKLNEMLS